MLHAHLDQQRWDREWDIERLRVIAKLWGADLPTQTGEQAPGPPSGEDRMAKLARWGGKVEIH